MGNDKKYGAKKERILIHGDGGYWKGSFTVEAAAVLPLVMLVLASVILLSFYVHDCAVFQGIACETVAAGQNCITPEERQEVMQEKKRQGVQKRFLGSRKISGNTAAGKRESTASFSAQYPVPGMVKRFFSKGILEIRRKWSGKAVDAPDTIRKIRGVKRLIEGETE